ncbi:MAG TPA: hypothetical protein VFS15_26510, partial [Kofleriaceae bacterium]|nr:hypothetical protein [Kofleriaceae bacterium]
MSSLRYAVRVEAPERHTAEIELRFAPDADEVDITMPAWCPGSYLIRDYARYVRDLSAEADGKPAPVRKLDKQTWRIAARGAREIVVRYAIYGHDLTVRTNHIDGEHAFLHGPATFVYPASQRDVPIEVELAFPESWVMVTAADLVTACKIRAAGIDELYDQPIHLGPTRTYPVP